MKTSLLLSNFLPVFQSGAFQMLQPSQTTDNNDTHVHARVPGSYSRAAFLQDSGSLVTLTRSIRLLEGRLAHLLFASLCLSVLHMYTHTALCHYPARALEGAVRETIGFQHNEAPAVTVFGPVIPLRVAF